MNSPSPKRGVLLVAAGAALWGTDSVLRQPLSQALSSKTIVMYEHLILATVMLPALWATRAEWLGLRARQWAALIGIAWGGSALATVFFTQAIKIGNPTTAVLLQKVQPLFTFLLASALLGERPQRRHWIFLFIAMAGAYLVSFGQSGLIPHLESRDATSALLALAAAALWGSSTVLGRYVSPRLGFVAITTLRIFLALPLLVVMNLPILGGTGLSGPQGSQWLALLWIALVPGLGALLLYYRGLRDTPAPLAAIAELCFPATTALLNWIFLDSPLTAWQAVGFLLIWGVVGRLQIGDAHEPQS